MRRKTDVEEVLARAIRFVAAARYYEADNKYYVATDLAPQDERGYCGIALARMGSGDSPEHVVKAMNDVLRMRPWAVYPHGIIAMAMQESGRWKGALASYDAMLRADPAEISAHAKKAQILHILGDRKAAAAEAAKCAKPLTGREYPREAARLRRIARDAKDGRPPSFQADDDLFILPGLRGLLDRALGPVERSAAPDFEEIAAAGADPEAAARAVGQELGKDPNSAVALLAKAAVLADGGQAGEAVICCEKAIESGPGNMNAHAAKAVLLFDGGDAGGAASCLESAIHNRPIGKNGTKTRKILRAWLERIDGPLPPFGPFRGASAVGLWAAGRRDGMGSPPACEPDGKPGDAPRDPKGLFPPGMADDPGERSEEERIMRDIKLKEYREIEPYRPGGSDYGDAKGSGWDEVDLSAERETKAPRRQKARRSEPKRARLRPGRRR